MNEDDNWLPPDNMQEGPVAAVAHRTSPTNMGLALLAHLAAHDFGYLSTGRMLERLERMLNAIHNLERYNGHLYNWYDTRTLEPLHPHYVSTVDNGNLAGHLLTLRPGLLELADTPVWDARALAGLADTAEVLGTALKAEKLDCPAWRAFHKAIEDSREASFPSLDEAADCLQRLLMLAEGLQAACRPEPGGDAAFWQNALIDQCRDIHDDIHRVLLPTAVTLTDHSLGLPTWRRLTGLDPRALPESARVRASEVRDLAVERVALADRLARRAAELADMDFDLLYDPRRDLLSIGYNVDERRRDASYYDLLASEARLAYFVAIASGQLPQDSWFSLGRLLTGVDGDPVLLSWSGSMFEYLMPALVMPSYPGSLLECTCRGPCAARSSTAATTACPGAYPNRVTTPWMPTFITSTARSACRAWVSNPAWARTWSSLPTPRSWPSCSRPKPPVATCANWPRRGRPAASACTRPWTARPCVCRAAKTRPYCLSLCPTIRA